MRCRFSGANNLACLVTRYAIRLRPGMDNEQTDRPDEPNCLPTVAIRMRVYTADR